MKLSRFSPSRHVLGFHGCLCCALSAPNLIQSAPRCARDAGKLTVADDQERRSGRPLTNAVPWSADHVDRGMLAGRTRQHEPRLHHRAWAQCFSRRVRSSHKSSPTDSLVAKPDHPPPCPVIGIRVHPNSRLIDGTRFVSGAFPEHPSKGGANRPRSTIQLNKSFPTGVRNLTPATRSQAPVKHPGTDPTSRQVRPSLPARVL